MVVGATYLGLLSLVAAGFAASLVSPRTRDIVLVAATAGVTGSVMVPILSYITGRRLAEITDVLNIHRTGVTDVHVTSSAARGGTLFRIIEELEHSETARIAFAHGFKVRTLDLVRWITEAAPWRETAILLPAFGPSGTNKGENADELMAAHLRSEIVSWRNDHGGNVRATDNPPSASFVITERDVLIVVEPLSERATPSIILRASRGSELWVACDRAFVDSWHQGQAIEASANA